MRAVPKAIFHFSPQTVSHTNFPIIVPNFDPPSHEALSQRLGYLFIFKGMSKVNEALAIYWLGHEAYFSK